MRVVIMLALVGLAVPAYGNVAQCTKDLEAMIQSPEALAVFAHWGTPPAGLTDLYWLGDFDGCKAMHPLHYCLLTRPVRPPGFPYEVPLKYGMCVPASCQADDGSLLHSLNGVEADVIELIKNKMHIPLPFNGTDLESGSKIACADPSEMVPGAVATITLCAVLGFFVFVSTMTDAWVAARKGWADLQRKAADSSGISVNGSSDDEPMLFAVVPGDPGARNKPEGVARRLLASFSLWRNVPKFLSSTRHPQNIDCLNGVRVLSMMWVVLAHSYLWLLQTGLANPTIAQTWGERFSFQIVSNGFFSVDSFFYMSGFLVTYGIIKSLTRVSKFPYVKYVVHRYLRLTPTYGFCILVYYWLGRYIGEGPNFSTYQYPPRKCGDYWWANMLYIQNFYPAAPGLDMCMGWSWYLAIDMQLFIIAPLLVIPLYKYKWKGTLLLSFVFVACLASTFAVSYTNHLRGNFLAGLFGEAPRKGAGDYASLIYIKPYTRAAPYLVGIVTAFAVVSARNKRAEGTWRPLALWQVLAGHIAALLLMFAAQFGLSGELHAGGMSADVTQVGDSFYITFSRMCWGIALGWLTYACDCGYTGVIGRFLEGSLFSPLARLTYTAYLIHPVILDTFYGSEKMAPYMDDQLQIVRYFGLICIVYMAATCITLGVEFPVGQVEKVLLGGGKK